MCYKFGLDNYPQLKMWEISEKMDLSLNQLKTHLRRSLGKAALMMKDFEPDRQRTNAYLNMQ